MARGLPSSPLVVRRSNGTPVHVQIATWLRAAIAAMPRETGRLGRVVDAAASNANAASD